MRELDKLEISTVNGANALSTAATISGATMAGAGIGALIGGFSSMQFLGAGSAIAGSNDSIAAIGGIFNLGFGGLTFMLGALRGTFIGGGIGLVTGATASYFMSEVEEEQKTA